MSGYIDQRELVKLAGMASKRTTEHRNKTRIRDYKAALAVKDRAQAINRFPINGMPNGMTSRHFEQLLYDKGRLCIFSFADKEFFLPYAMVDGIDAYGRYIALTPLVIGSTGDKKEKAFINGLKRTIIYTLEEAKELIEKHGADYVKNNYAVVIYDYSKGMSQDITPRAQLQEPILEQMAETIQLNRSAMFASVGISALRVNDEATRESVVKELSAIEEAILDGKRYIPITSTLEIDELQSDKNASTQTLWEAFQSLDSLRLSLLGIENDGVFNKKAHTLEVEQEVETTNTRYVYDDGLQLRKDFIEIANLVFGLKMSVEENKLEEEEEQEQEQQQEEGDNNDTDNI